MNEPIQVYDGDSIPTERKELINSLKASMRAREAFVRRVRESIRQGVHPIQVDKTIR